LAGSTRRQRQLAREHYERQQARRTAAAARRRRRQQVISVVLVAVLVAAGVVVLGQALGDGSGDVAAEESPSPTASATESGTEESDPEATPADEGCVYTETGDGTDDVGVPTFDEDAAARPLTATIATNRGDIEVALATGAAPCATNSFRYLADEGYYDDSTCHRLTTDNIFVLQCGDPSGTGSGGPGYRFGVENAPEDGVYPAGTLAMARTADPGSNGSQFFVVYERTSLPDPDGYTVFGQVTKGLDLVREVADAGVEGGGGDGAPAEPVTITSVSVARG
jgi:peptidyl-prolyl cis-trans isomerase B (cyclophilin B)